MTELPRQNTERETFKLLFLALALILMLLPFVTSFNSVLTEIFQKLRFYTLIQANIAPWEAKMVVMLIKLLGVEVFLAEGATRASFFLVKGGTQIPVVLEWNCLGWQSLILLVVSLVIGLQGHYTRSSVMECILIGLFGTFLINILRLVFITVGIYYVNTVFAFLIHDYFAALTTIAWLFFFWWFSYTFILEEKQSSVQKEAMKV